MYRLGVAISDGMDEVRGKVFRIGNMGYLTRRDVLTLITGIVAALLINGGNNIDGGAMKDVFKEVLSYWEPEQLLVDEG